MEGACGLECGACLLEIEVRADHIDYVAAEPDVFENAFWNCF